MVLLKRIILCFDLCIWFLRLLNVSIVFKALGPKLVMIQKMVNTYSYLREPSVIWFIILAADEYRINEASLYYDLLIF